MKALKQFTILTALAVVISATTIPPIPTTDSTEANESINNTVIPSASVGQVEVPATVQEVKSDWLENDESLLENDNEADTVDDDEDFDVDEEEIEDEDEFDDVDEDEEEEPSVDEEDYLDEATQEGFEANVPSAIHETKDVVINKDNMVPILKTIVLAYTHKTKPSYTDLLKAGGISAFKTGFKYFGKESLGMTLLKMAKTLTSALDDEETDDINSEVLSHLAEEYLSAHRFKLVLPESVLLHQQEMEEFLSARDIHEIEGRSLVSNNQFDIAMPRADPAVQTILTIGPMTWMAVIGGLFSIPWLLSGSEEPARVDHVIPNLSPYLRAPGLPFFQTHQLRRDENEQAPHQQIDQEYLEYQQSYAQWYNNWYLKYKSYYDENYPNHQQPVPQSNQRQEVSSLDVMVPPPPVDTTAKNNPQKPLHPPQKPLPPKHQLPKQPPPIQFPGAPQVAGIPQAPRVPPLASALQAHGVPRAPGLPLVQGVPRAPGVPQVPSVRQVPGVPQVPSVRQVPGVPQLPLAQQVPGVNARNAAGAHEVNAANNKANSFGTFQSEGNKGDSHFRVIQGPEANLDTAARTPRPRPRFPSQPSPQPVYVPTSEAPQTESGFKPITKPNTPVSEKSTTPATDDKTEFKAPREETLLSKNTPSSKPKSTAQPNPADKTAGGFKPISGPTDAKKQEVETTTIKVSGVTSSVFKTSPNPTPAAATTPNPGSAPSDIITPRPAVFVRTATQKSVRVVTSSSFVVPQAAPLVASESSSDSLPDLKRPQRHQQSNPAPQQIKQEQKIQQQPLPLHQRLPQQQQNQQPPRVPQQQQQNQPQSSLPQQQQQSQPQARLPQQQQQQPPLPLQQRPPQQQAFPSPPQIRPNEATSGFVRTNVPTTIQVVDHRPAQGFGLGAKPTEPPTTTTSTPIPIYALDPFYGARLSRTDVIFHQLGVEDEGCREQVVCNIYKNPDVYTPFSDFLSRQLTVKLEELQKPKVSDERILRFFRYLKAAREGQNGSDCLSKYPECHFDTLTLSHKPIMNAFEKVSLLINAGSS